MATVLNIKHLKRLHAALMRSGAAVHDTLAIGKLVADIALSHPANIRYARAIFSNLTRPNIFMWNSMIRAYAHSPSPQEAIILYRQMLAEGFSPNNYTFPFVLKASTSFSDPRVGLGVHASIILRGFEDFDPFIQTSLMSFYAASGYVDTARRLFDSCPSRDVASWNALIKGYIQSGRYTDVVHIFRRMQDREKFEGDEITMLNVVSACAHLGALDMGRWIHAYIDKRKLRLTVNLGTALINMYARCGEIEAAYSLFQEMHDKDVRTWSVMIGGFAINGFANKSLDLFSRMQVAAGISPDSVTLTAVLAACSHAGFVREGIKFFETMDETYFVKPTIEHYGCVVDLLGRAGRLEEALDLIKRIPLQLDVALWGSLLVACRVHKNLVMGELAAKEMLKLDPCNAGALVFLSNVYASTGQWEQVEAVRDSMKERKILKPPGSSVIEVGGIIHEFLSGDQSIPQMHQVYMMLNEITRLRGLDGHNRTTEGISFNIDEEDKEQCLSQHSEKLSVAFGLINTAPGTTIRIVKNLRICDDCHSTMKFVSKAFTRLVIVRDRSRFHHFRDGACSCGDYW